MKYNRIEIAENIGFSSVIDSKFKTVSLVIRFITELDKSTVSENALGFSYLSDSNSKLNTIALLNEKLSELYGAEISSSVRKRGDVQILGLSSSWLSNRYAIDGEDIESEMTGIFMDCLFSPNAADGRYDSELFAITQKDMLDRIDAEINNKRGYALVKGMELACKGEPAENSANGTRETASAVTVESAYNAYRRILETAQVEIFYVSPDENTKLPELFRENFSRINRRSHSCVFRTISPFKDETEILSEELDVRQSKMVMCFKTDSDDVFALKMLSTIYGETPVSKLFANVREKLSLCYYCACRFTQTKNILCVDSGVEKGNIEKAKEEILNQLDEIRKGNISDDEIESALLSLDNGFTSIGDTPYSYSTWYFERFCDGKIVTPEEQFNEYRNITKARLIQAAQSLRLDSIYYMLNKEAEE